MNEPNLSSLKGLITDYRENKDEFYTVFTPILTNEQVNLNYALRYRCPVSTPKFVPALINANDIFDWDTDKHLFNALYRFGRFLNSIQDRICPEVILAKRPNGLCYRFEFQYFKYDYNGLYPIAYYEYVGIWRPNVNDQTSVFI